MSLGFKLPGYSNLELLKQSSRSLIYCAHRESDQSPVAIKVYNKDFPTPDDVARFKHEYEIIKDLNLNYLVKAYNFEKVGNSYGIVLQLGPTSLDAHVGELIAIEQLLQIAWHVANGLAEIHGKGLIHRDIKPSNILWDVSTDTLKIIDFGIATYLGHENRSKNADLEGTIQYISPEQTGRMNCKVDYRTDFYSLGVTLFQLATGQLPYVAYDSIGWIHCHLSEKAPLASDFRKDLPLPLVLIIEKLLAKNADERYQSAFGLSEDLAQCLAQYQQKHRIEPFALATKDYPAMFRLPLKLYGREAETMQILNAFNNVRQGGKELILVTGASGIGKSSLIQEIHKPVVERRGFFIEGKFDQYNRNISYTGLTQAFSMLVTELLSLPEDQLELWRHRILEAVEPSGQVLLDFAPALEKVIGLQPACSQLDSAEAKNRLQMTLQKFINVFASSAQPLVLFIDDLQWADAPTLSLLENWLTTASIKNLLIIAAYRDNEIDANHIVNTFLKDVQKKIEAQMIAVEPLKIENIEELIQDAFGDSSEQGKEFARILHQKTHANPFFVEKMLLHLDESKAFSFDQKKGAWNYDLTAIKAVDISDNVLEFMVSSLKQLDLEARTLIQVAACVGSSFDSATLKTVLDTARLDIHATLKTLLQKELIYPLDNKYKFETASNAKYRFGHDRIQQAAYSLIPEEDRLRAHWQIGKQLRLSLTPSELEERLAEVVNHYNQARSLIATKEEIFDLMELNLRIGMKAFYSSAFEIALFHYDLAFEISPATSWDEKYDLIKNIQTYRMYCSFLSDRRGAAEAMTIDTLPRLKSDVERSQFLNLKLKVFVYKSLLAEAVDVGLTSLNYLGMKLKVKASPVQIFKELMKANKFLKKHQIEEFVNWKVNPSKEDELISQMLLEICPALYLTGNEGLFFLVVLKAFNLTCEKGLVVNSGFVLVNFALVLQIGFKRYDEAFRMGKAAVALTDKFENVQAKGKTNYLFAFTILPWNEPIRNVKPHLKEAMAASHQTGDVAFYSYASNWLVELDPDIGLKEAVHRDWRQLAFLEGVRHDDMLSMLRVLQAKRLCLLDLEQNPISFDSARIQENAVYDMIESRKFATAKCLFFLTKLQLSYMYEDYAKALFYAQATQKESKSLLGTVWEPQVSFFSFMAYAKRLPDADFFEAIALKRNMRREYSKVKLWRRNVPSLFDYMERAMDAEYASLAGDKIQVLSHYNAAILGARDLGLPLVEAQMSEYAGRYFAGQKDSLSAANYFQRAYACYQSLGAERKMLHLKERYGMALHLGMISLSSQSKNFRSDTQTSGTTSTKSSETTTFGYASRNWDVESILKATQALSQEVVFSKLVSKIIETIKENIGATKVVLLLPSGQILRIEAAISKNDSQILTHESLADAKGLCLKIVHLAARSQEVVILSNASKKGDFVNDMYIRENNIHSVLCVPLLDKNKLFGVLYAENELTAGAFSASHVQVVSILCAQAVVSIENARLYETLEKKVAERTLQLAQKNKDMQTMLQNMKQGVFTFDSSRLINPEYSLFLEEILGRKQLAGQDIMTVLLKPSNLSKDDITKIVSVIEVTIGERRANFDINRASLPACFVYQGKGDDRVLQLDWEPILNSAGIIEAIMVIVRDVTELRQLQKEATEQRRELEMVREIFQGGKDFLGVLENLQQLSDANWAMSRKAELSQADIESLRRNVHTIKGNARIGGLVLMVEKATELEGYLGTGEAKVDREMLLLGLREERRALLAYEKIYKKLGLVHGLQDYEAILATASQSLSSILAVSRHGLEKVAKDIGKPVPELLAVDGGIAFDRGTAQALRNILTHCLTNSLDHGIEPAASRLAAHKSERGCIRIVGQEAGDKVLISIEDDGRGLNLARLEGLAGGGKSDEELAASIFVAGLTTATKASSISGQGVGMDAIRHYVRQLGGDVSVQFTAPREGDYRRFKLVMTLPAGVVAMRRV